MTAEDQAVERQILSSWPLVGWWHVTGEPGRWSRRRLIGAALCEVTTTTGTGKSRRQSVARYVTGLTLEIGRAELAADGGYFVCELDAWPTCQCERPRTSDHDPRFCHRDAALVVAPEREAPATVPPRSASRSAVDQWLVDHPQAQDV